MPQTPETYLLVLARLASQWGGLWGLRTSLGIRLMDARIWDKCRGTPSPGAHSLASVLGGPDCCEIKMVSEGIAASLNGFADESTHAGSSSNSFLCLPGSPVQQLNCLWRSGTQQLWPGGSRGECSCVIDGKGWGGGGGTGMQ